MAIPMFNPEFEDNTFGKGMLTMMASFAPGRKGRDSYNALAAAVVAWTIPSFCIR
jgi:hypothetical protein